MHVIDITIIIGQRSVASFRLNDLKCIVGLFLSYPYIKYINSKFQYFERTKLLYFWTCIKLIVDIWVKATDNYSPVRDENVSLQFPCMSLADKKAR